jgi:hypothetical protein
MTHSLDLVPSYSCRAAVEAAAEELGAAVKRATAELRLAIEAALAPAATALEAGAADAAANGAAAANKWARRRWNTYRATVRNHGVFRDADWNEDLAGPALEAALPAWDRAFGADIPAAVAVFRAAVVLALDAAVGRHPWKPAEAATLRAHRDSAKTLLKVAAGLALEEARRRQPKLRATMTELVPTAARPRSVLRRRAPRGGGSSRRLARQAARKAAGRRGCCVVGGSSPVICRLGASECMRAGWSLTRSRRQGGCLILPDAG